MRSVRYWALIAVLVSTPCLAQRRIALEISHAGSDKNASALLAELREAVRSFESPESAEATATAERYAMRLTNNASRARIKLQLLTAEMQPAGATAVAVTVIYDAPHMALGGAVIRGMLETCSPGETAACAKRILTKSSAAVDWLRDNWPALWNTL